MSPRTHVSILGASGRVGRVLANGLAGDYALRLVDRVLEPHGGAECVAGDLLDPALMQRAVEGADTVVHLAVVGAEAAFWDTEFPDNDALTQGVLDACVAAGCRRLIFASSSLIDLAPELAYARMKLRAEAAAAEIAAHTPLSVHCLRMGRVEHRRSIELWPGQPFLDHILTHADLLRLFRCSIAASADVDFGVFYGLSANAENRFDQSETYRQLDYAPEDDAFALAERMRWSPRGIARRMKSAVLRR